MSKATPRYGHEPIAMERYDQQPFTKAGQFTWSMDEQGRRSLVVALPLSKDLSRFCACEWTIDHKNHCDASWSWNKDKVKPTLKPSLHWVGAWHGWVTDGVLKEA
jgi:hypothetical protein